MKQLLVHSRTKIRHQVHEVLEKHFGLSYRKSSNQESSILASIHYSAAKLLLDYYVIRFRIVFSPCDSIQLISNRIDLKDFYMTQSVNP